MECALAPGNPSAMNRKRKADIQDNNERLSKRLALLNIERNGQKLYVPVERPTTSPKAHSIIAPHTQAYEDMMQLDDTKHKVYIYDLDAELSDTESDDGKLVFLPDIEKHLRDARIPSSVLANYGDELASQKQLVLYSVPSSLTVPEEQDSVRKAIIEARARARAKAEQRRIVDEGPDNIGNGVMQLNGFHPTDLGVIGHTEPGPQLLNGIHAAQGQDGSPWYGMTNGVSGMTNGVPSIPTIEDIPMDDPDAMDIG